jgi:hypothetical protein
VWILGEPEPSLEGRVHHTMLSTEQSRVAADLLAAEWDFARRRYRRVLVEIRCSGDGHRDESPLIGRVVNCKLGPLLVTETGLDRGQRRAELAKGPNDKRAMNSARTIHADVLTWKPADYEGWSCFAHFRCGKHGERLGLRSALIEAAVRQCRDRVGKVPTVVLV